MKPEERTVDLSYPFEKVWEATWTALPLAGWELTRADRTQGHFDAKVGVNLYTWREDFSMDLTKNDEGSTRIHVWGKVRHQLYDWGKTRRDIDRFISLLQITLRER